MPNAVPVLDVTTDGPVRIVTLNRPAERNAIDGALHSTLANIWAEVADDPDAGAVVLTGAGDSFSAGGDFAWMTTYQTDMAYRDKVAAEARRIITEMVTLPLPLIAAVNGPAVGLGASLAVSCDIVLLSDRSFMADPHVAVGLVCGDGGAIHWPLLTSLIRAKEYLFTGERIPPAQAVQWGLANRVVHHDDVLSEALKLAHRLAALPRQALVDTKRALNLHAQMALAFVMDFALTAERESMGSPEHISRIAALRDQASRRRSARPSGVSPMADTPTS